MASKENQMSLDTVATTLPFETYICQIHTLQQAIDDLELYKKALEIATSNDDVNDFYREDLGINCMACLDSCNKEKRQQCVMNKCLEQAREELENGK